MGNCLDWLLKKVYGDGTERGCPRCPLFGISIALLFVVLGYGVSLASADHVLPKIYQLVGILISVSALIVILFFILLACLGGNQYSRLNASATLRPGRTGSGYATSVTSTNLTSSGTTIHIQDSQENMRKWDNHIQESAARDAAKEAAAAKNPPPSPHTSASTSSSSFQIIHENGAPVGVAEFYNNIGNGNGPVIGAAVLHDDVLYPIQPNYNLNIHNPTFGFDAAQNSEAAVGHDVSSNQEDQVLVEDPKVNGDGPIGVSTESSLSGEFKNTDESPSR